MTKTIVYLAMSLDGFIAGKRDDLSWLKKYEKVDYGYGKFLSGIGAIIEGRRTYDIEVKLGVRHLIPQFVLCHDIKGKRANNKKILFVNRDISNVLSEAKKISGKKDVWILGGANVIQQYIKKGLIDKMIITIVPVILGSGIRLFENIYKKINLKLKKAENFDKGLVMLSYFL